MGKLTNEEFAMFRRRFFLADCRRRFHELGGDSIGLLGFEHLRGALVEMFPTFKLDLKAEGHHIAALDKCIPSLIATFDADSDGYLDFDDFVRLIKFQHAWRSQFFLSNALESRLKSQASMVVDAVGIKPASNKQARLKKNASLPQLKRTQKGGLKKSLSIATIDSDDRPSSSASCSTRCSTAQSTRSNLSHLDSSRGAFYSTLMGFS
jgi:hypothetical protein